MVFKWRDDYIEPFLDQYRQHECLWNISCGSYKNRVMRDKAYESMCVDLNFPGLTVNDIKSKIKTIRTNYKSELNKILKSEKSGAGFSDLYVPRLFWFKKADQFLRGVSEAKNSISNLTVELETTSGQNDTSPVTDDITDERSKEETEITESLNVNVNVNAAATETYKTPRKSAKKRVYSEMSSIENSINKLQAISNSCKDDDDEFDLFGKSIAVQLKKMPLDRAFVCQEKIMGVMKQERLYKLTEDNQRLQKSFEANLTDDMSQSSPDFFSEQSTSSSWPCTSISTPSENISELAELQSSDVLSTAIANTFWP